MAPLLLARRRCRAVPLAPRAGPGPAALRVQPRAGLCAQREKDFTAKEKQRSMSSRDTSKGTILRGQWGSRGHFFFFFSCAATEAAIHFSPVLFCPRNLSSFFFFFLPLEEGEGKFAQCKFQSMQGSAGCSPERPLRQEEGMGHPPSFHCAPRQVQDGPVWGLPGQRRCGGRSAVPACPRGWAQPAASPYCRTGMRTERPGWPSALPPQPRPARRTACALRPRCTAISTVALLAGGSCATPVSFSGEMFDLDPSPLLKTGRLFHILVRNKNRTKHTRR